MKPDFPRGRLLVLLGLLALAVGWAFGRYSAMKRTRKAPTEAIVETQARNFLALEAREAAVEQSSAAVALEAFQHEDVLLDLWRRAHQNSNAWAFLLPLPWPAMRVAPFLEERIAGTGLVRHRQNGVPNEVAPASLVHSMASLASNHWALATISLRQTHYQPATQRHPATSEVAVSLSLSNRVDRRRMHWRGPIQIQWKPTDTGGSIQPSRIDATALELLSTDAPPEFSLVGETELNSTPTISIDPLLSGDIDGDGSLDLVCVGAGQVLSYRNGRMEARPLPGIPKSATHAAVLCDWDRDGHWDLLIAADSGLYWMRGRTNPSLLQPAELLWNPYPPSSPESARVLKHAQTITVADIDGDGDLDVFLAQYKVPYQRGQFPTPYHDANDGFPSFLLRNDGGTRLVDVTSAAGLDASRFRRTYSASFVDVNKDGSPDLVVVADFAGIELFQNNGKGHFSNASDSLGDERHAFGMSHAFGDFNGDGRVDILMLGMDSPTASVLEALNVRRSRDDTLSAARKSMAYGNRLYVSRNDGRFDSPAWASSLAATGWTWGAAAFDADNDGRTDLYCANGHESFANPTDYERQFWLHDIYVGTSSNDPVAELYFRSALGRRRADQRSYGGWQDNRFLKNLGDATFLECGYLAGIAHREDSRNVLAEDWDGDGRVDLLVSTYELWPQARQRLFLHRNQHRTTGHWIGLKLPPLALNGTVQVKSRSGSQTQWLTTGESYRVQHSTWVHFGLGTDDAAESVEIQWGNGTRRRLQGLAINRWHEIQPE